MSENGAPPGPSADGNEPTKEQQELAEKLERVKAAGWNNTIAIANETVGSGAVPEDPGLDDAPWLCNAVVYQWDDDYGEIGPENPKLEEELFYGQHLMKAGNRIKALDFDVQTFGPVDVKPIRSYEDAGLHPAMLENVKKCGYNYPTPIQAYTIPALLTGHDVVGIAQTGSGKTAAYLVPVLSMLMGKARILAAPRPNPSRYNPLTDRVRAEPLVLIVCPTRELACQIFDEARRLCYRTMLRPCVIYGGAPSKLQREQLEMGCDILIATPGRLVDFMRNINLVSFNRLKYTIIDEADEMLTTGWEEVMEKLFNGADMNTDADHTYMMFSATFPKAERKLAREYMEEDFVTIKVGRAGSTHENIKQEVVYVEKSAKDQALLDLLFSGIVGRTIVFVNSKYKCDAVDDYLYRQGLPCTSMHSERSQREREDALRAFKNGKTPIMVATGVSARGLDVANVKHVINYDLPSGEHGGITEYIHRIGRTARIGNEGQATSFYNDDNQDIAEDLVKVLLEAHQPVPDFLEQFKPENPEDIDFHDATDDESDAGGADFGSGFGGGDFGGGFEAGFDGDTGADTGGFQADAGFQADDGFQADAGNKVDSW